MELRGIPALQSTTPATDGHLLVTPRPGDGADVDFWETRGARVVRAYDVEMTKRIHFVVIAKDFGSFQHLHPALGPDGHFRLVLRVPAGGPYELYADTVPHGDAQAVFRFETTIGAAAARHVVRRPPLRTGVGGPYTVTVNATHLAAGHESEIVALVAREGRPAMDLRPYLGAAAHVVLIDERTFAYVHVHPESPDDAGRRRGTPMPGMAMPGMEMSRELPPDAKIAPTMVLHVRVTDPGRYRMFVQLRGGNGLAVAPLSLIAR